MQITTAIGALALVLAALGLFGVMSYSVARRTNEIGVRVALGARGADIGRMVVGQALRPIALGVVVGIPLAIGSMRLLQHHLTATAAGDPLAIAMAVTVLTLCGVAAALIPARRASRIDPIQALRQE
jgi:ABC-type antimicrobial peptide transport system permease subunit